MTVQMYTAIVTPKVLAAMDGVQWRYYLKARRRTALFYLSNQVKPGQKEGPLSGASSLTSRSGGVALHR